MLHRNLLLHMPVIINTTIQVWKNNRITVPYGGHMEDKTLGRILNRHGVKVAHLGFPSQIYRLGLQPSLKDWVNISSKDRGCIQFMHGGDFKNASNMRLWHDYMKPFLHPSHDVYCVCGMGESKLMKRFDYSLIEGVKLEVLKTGKFDSYGGYQKQQCKQAET